MYDEIETSYGHTVRVQESSAAEAPHVWLFVSDSPVVVNHNPQLTVEQAIRVRDALTAFIDERGEVIHVDVCKCGQILCVCKGQ